MKQGMSGRVGISGTIEYRDADGNVIKTVPFSGAAEMSDDDGPEAVEPAADEGQPVAES